MDHVKASVLSKGTAFGKPIRKGVHRLPIREIHHRVLPVRPSADAHDHVHHDPVKEPVFWKIHLTRKHRCEVRLPLDLVQELPAVGVRLRCILGGFPCGQVDREKCIRNRPEFPGVAVYIPLHLGMVKSVSDARTHHHSIIPCRRTLLVPKAHRVNRCSLGFKPCGDALTDAPRMPIRCPECQQDPFHTEFFSIGIAHAQQGFFRIPPQSVNISGWTPVS